MWCDLACIVVVCGFFEIVYYYECLDWLESLLGVCVCVVQVRTVVDTDSLAQASLPRQSEMCKGSPRAFCASGRPGDHNVF